MKSTVFSIILLSWLVLIHAGKSAAATNRDDDDTKLTKTITRSFRVPKHSHVAVINKYGPVVINSWDQDSVFVEIEITAFGKNDKTVNKIMGRVDFDFDQKNQYLTLATVLDRSSGFFTELWNNIGDYSKTLLSQNQLKIEYTLYLPETSALEVTNKFGDIYVDDYDGDLEINLSHGNFRGGNITGSLEMDLSFGNADAKFVKEADLVLKATEVEFNQMGRSTIHSSSSEILINNIRDLQIDSRSDRRFMVKNAGNVSGTGSFSKIQLDSFEESLDLDLNYGEFKLNKLEPGFSRLDLQGKTTVITLDFADGNYLDFEYVGKENKLFVSSGKDRLSKEYIDDSEKTVRINGFLGRKNETPARVVVKTESGEVNVTID